MNSRDYCPIKKDSTHVVVRRISNEGQRLKQQSQGFPEVPNTCQYRQRIGRRNISRREEIIALLRSIFVIAVSFTRTYRY